MVEKSLLMQGKARMMGGLALGVSVVATAYGMGVAGVPGDAFVAALDWCLNNDFIRFSSPNLEMTIRAALV